MNKRQTETMRSRFLALSLLAALLGCATNPPPRPEAPSPPWTAGKQATRATELSVPDGQIATIEGQDSFVRINVGKGARLDTGSVTSVSGGIVVGENATLNAPNLKIANGFIVVGRGAEVIAPELAKAERVEVGVRVERKNRADMPRPADYAREVNGSPSDAIDPYWVDWGEFVYLVTPIAGPKAEREQGARVEANALVEVWGSRLLVGKGSNMIAPSLRLCGKPNVGEGATLEAPCAGNRTRAGKN